MTVLFEYRGSLAWEKGLFNIVHHCALHSIKVDIQHITSIMKTTFFMFLIVYRLSVFFFFCPMKNIFLNSITFSDPRGPSSVPLQKIKTLMCDFAKIYLLMCSYLVYYLSDFSCTERK